MGARELIQIVVTCVVCCVICEISTGRAEETKCEAPWVEVHRICMLFVKTAKTWEAANNYCEKEGKGSLVSVTSFAKKNKLRKYLKTIVEKPADQSWWVGLSYDSPSSKWLWQDASDLNADVVNWKPGEPNGLSKGQHCAMMNFRMQLVDEFCTREFNFICERIDITPATTLSTVPTTPTTLADRPINDQDVRESSVREDGATDYTNSEGPPLVKTQGTVAGMVTWSTSEMDQTQDLTSTITEPMPSTDKQGENKPENSQTRNNKGGNNRYNDGNSNNNNNSNNNDNNNNNNGKNNKNKNNSTNNTNENNIRINNNGNNSNNNGKNNNNNNNNNGNKNNDTNNTNAKNNINNNNNNRNNKNGNSNKNNNEKNTNNNNNTNNSSNKNKNNNNHKNNTNSPKATTPENPREPNANSMQESHCPAQKAFDLEWPMTEVDSQAIVSCNNEQGNATRDCRSNGKWKVQADLSDCVSETWNKIAQIAKNKTNTTVSADDIIEIAKTLNETYAQVNTEDVSAADIAVSTQVFDLFGKVTPKNDTEAATVVKELVLIGSRILRSTSRSRAVQKKDKRRAAAHILRSIEESSSALAKSLKSPKVITKETANIKLELHVVDVNNTETNEVVYGGGRDSPDRFRIPLSILKRKSEGGISKVVFLLHTEIGALLQDTEPTNQDRASIEVASNVLSASVGAGETTQLDDPVHFTMKLQQSTPSDLQEVCSFWNFSLGEEGAWSQEGCSLVTANGTHVTCECHHLTNFAILLDVRGVEVSAVHTSMLKFITYIGCIISIVCLFAAFITFISLSSLQGERNSIHKNLAFSLFAAEVIFIAGIDQVTIKIPCSIVAMLLHFFFLSAFLWMLMEAIQIAIMLVQVFDTAKSRMKYFYTVAYGLPLVIVATVAGINFSAYGTDKHCWITTEGWYIWTFAGPVAAILVFNAVILVCAMVSVCRHSEYVFRGGKTKTSTLKEWIQGALALEVLLGLTWVFGYFFINEETVTLAYIFTILNSLQGLFIFFFHCVLNKKVRAEYKKLVKMSTSTTASTTKSASFRKPAKSYDMYASSISRSNLNAHSA